MIRDGLSGQGQVTLGGEDMHILSLSVFRSLYHVAKIEQAKEK